MTKSNIIEYKLQIIDSDFYHDFLDKDLKNKPIKCAIKSELEIKIGSETIKKKSAILSLLIQTSLFIKKY